VRSLLLSLEPCRKYTGRPVGRRSLLMEILDPPRTTPDESFYLSGAAEPLSMTTVPWIYSACAWTVFCMRLSPQTASLETEAAFLLLIFSDLHPELDGGSLALIRALRSSFISPEVTRPVSFLSPSRGPARNFFLSPLTSTPPSLRMQCDSVPQTGTGVPSRFSSPVSSSCPSLLLLAFPSAPVIPIISPHRFALPQNPYSNTIPSPRDPLSPRCCLIPLSSFFFFFRSLL